MKFTKMQGLGNDFVVLDAVSQPLVLDAERIRKLADRKFGVGCDQVLLAEPRRNEASDFYYRIYNADGTQAEQCGNGARCMARFLVELGHCPSGKLRLETSSGLISAQALPDGQVAVGMGMPRLAPAEIPLLRDRQASHYEACYGAERVEFAAVSMGNPHAVIRVEDVARADVARLGPLVQADRSFPNGVNVGFMQVLDRGRIALRVYERGAGETLACGTGACAAVVAGRLWGLLDARVSVRLPGGMLVIEWPGTGSEVIMTGPAVRVFEGQIEL